MPVRPRDESQDICKTEIPSNFNNINNSFSLSVPTDMRALLVLVMQLGWLTCMKLRRSRPFFNNFLFKILDRGTTSSKYHKLIMLLLP